MLVLVIAVLAAAQSLFGVGLLLIGTPTLLAWGLPFRDVLWIVLPASLTVSLLQIVVDRQVERAWLRSLAVVAVPALVAGLLVAIQFPITVDMTPAVAVMLAIAAVTRLQPRLSLYVRQQAARHERPLLGIIGFIHGLTNMGGSLLLDFASARHVAKVAVRQQVAAGYVLFASTQLLVLAAVDGIRLSRTTAVHMAVAAVVYLVIGRRTFESLSQPVFSTSLSVFMLAAACWLGWRVL